ncbi:Na+/H+ antiporter NhaA [Kaistia terrae]|uniref:Na(+)/H(+) antiporter NhaA n=1 Tax=Kaistia terrae TaxID=537017 RepID=A0ABW0PVZ8_9HYPH|nr:Na+/H+ antiporter NhaA [Kaistia terrae]MCX5579464.1 Na+/H+ antiporter NhaA [Kaistia terrae]
MPKPFAPELSFGRINATLRRFLDSETSGGLVLMAVASLALVVANSPVAPIYFSALQNYLGPLSVQHWVNDALMAVFFLMVGLEIKREMTDGHLSSWSRRLLPGAAAAGGMIAPALIFVALNYHDHEAIHGWAIPSATDIAFALAVLSLLGPRVPASLKVFLAALAILDDLGAVIIIAVFYSKGISVPDLLAATAILVVLIGMNRAKVMQLSPYMAFGVLLWFFTYRSGVHATIAGVLLALTVPIKLTPGTPEAAPEESPLHRLEQALHRPVAFLIVPIFGFANAGVSFAGVTLSSMLEPLSLGVASGLFLGKLIGVFGAAVILVGIGVAKLPPAASWGQMLGVAFLCGIGFTMSLFIDLLAFDDPVLQDRVKLGILFGSAASGIAGYLILRVSSRRGQTCNIRPLSTTSA